MTTGRALRIFFYVPGRDQPVDWAFSLKLGLPFDQKLQLGLAIECFLLGLVQILLNADAVGFAKRCEVIELTFVFVGLLTRLVQLALCGLDLLVEFVVFETHERLVFFDVVAVLDKYLLDFSVDVCENLPFDRGLKLAIALKVEIHGDQEHR